MIKEIINRCVFCEKDLSKGKMPKDFTLIPWQNDPDNPKSFNKIAKCCHSKCLQEFVELNFDEISLILFDIYQKNKKE